MYENVFCPAAANLLFLFGGKSFIGAAIDYLRRSEELRKEAEEGSATAGTGQSGRKG